MKVGTDAVLIGAWSDVGEARKILDIGTGSGIIALMMAQRSHPDCHVDAIELLEPDARQASENFSSSPWPQKVSVIQKAVQDYEPQAHYDLIVCNAPYFSGSLLPPSASRSIVRHNQSLTQQGLIAATIRLLSPNGAFSLILPPKEGQAFTKLAAEAKLSLNRHTRFFSRRDKPQERSLLEFRFSSPGLKEDSLTLYESGYNWTEQYTQLTWDFYLTAL